MMDQSPHHSAPSLYHDGSLWQTPFPHVCGFVYSLGKPIQPSSCSETAWVALQTKPTFLSHGFHTLLSLSEMRSPEVKLLFTLPSHIPPEVTSQILCVNRVPHQDCFVFIMIHVGMIQWWLSIQPLQCVFYHTGPSLTKLTSDPIIPQALFNREKKKNNSFLSNEKIYHWNTTAILSKDISKNTKHRFRWVYKRQRKSIGPKAAGTRHSWAGP